MFKHIRLVIASARLFILLLVLAPAMAAAQIPTGSVSGRVTDSQGRSIGAVTVTVSSPALQGVQTATTTPNGDFLFRYLPPGVYTVAFDGRGFAVERLTRSVSSTEDVRLNVTLAPAAVAESVTVEADASAFGGSAALSTHMDQVVLDTLPTGRTMLSAVSLAPGVHETGPNGGFSIAGAMSFESSYLLNGVQIQDNIRGEPLTLFIEDAIQETTTTTGGVSAEYGHFSGGVINTLTKSGGNLFSGSFRTSFRNDDWRTTSPFEESKIDSLIPTYEFTAGGPLRQNRTWFFFAGRLEDAETSDETAFTEIPYVTTQKERRFEVKGTQALATAQRLEVAYTDLRSSQTNASQGTILDLASLIDPESPQSLLAAHYTGVLTDNMFVEAQYSQRNFTFKNAGGTNPDRILGTALNDNQTGAYWWAPQYCGNCGDEERDNSALLLKASSLLSTERWGSHNLTFGYDTFNDRITGDNHQSASDYHVWTSGTLIDDGVVYPIIAPGFSTFIIHWPILEASQGTNFRTHSLFANDSWALNNHWSFNLGVRYDKNAGRDASDNLVANDSRVSPRLAASYDVKGDGKYIFNTSYGQYVSAVSNSIAGSSSPAGTPAILAYFYDGAPINTDGGPLVTSDAALRQVFDWFDAANPSPFQASIPGIALRVDDSIQSPYSEEAVIGYSHQLTSSAAFRVDFVNRTYHDFYSERVDTTTGQASDEFGQVFDVGVIENTNLLSRRYRALNAQFSYRVHTALAAGGSYTLSRLWGNFDGENIGSGPVSADVLRYPEYRELSWAFPEGDLSADQRHRSRLWATYTLPFGRELVETSFGVVQNLESGTPYGAVGSVLVDPFVANPGYEILPETMPYYFTSRDAFRTESQRRTDLALTLRRRLGGTTAPDLSAQFQLFNVFNQFQLANLSGGEINTTTVTAISDPNLDFFDPFTETPVEGVNWREGRRFGQAVDRGAYTLPRTFRFSLRLRF